MERLMFSKLSAALLIAGVTMGLSSGAYASDWNAHHPRRHEVNARLNHQNHRITQERKEGELTKGQAMDLRAEDRGIRAQERYDASKDGGHITRAEKAHLNHEENGVSRQIGQ